MFSCLCKDGLDSRLGQDATLHSPAAIDMQSQVHLTNNFMRLSTRQCKSVSTVMLCRPVIRAPA